MPSGRCRDAVPPGIRARRVASRAGRSRTVPADREPVRRIANPVRTGPHGPTDAASAAPKDMTSRRHRQRMPGDGLQAVGWTARAARNWRSKAVGGESRLGAPKWNPWA